MRSAAVLLVSLCWLPAAAAEPAYSAALSTGRPLSLSEAFSLALARSETLARRAASAAEAEARVLELRAAVLPGLTLTGSQFIQDAQQSGSSVQGTLARRTRPEARLSLTQPLFSGFREFLALRGAKELAAAAELRRRRAESLLYLDVARAYLDLLGSHAEIRTRLTVLETTRRRVAELRERVRLGRSRRGELLLARAQAADREAMLSETAGREKVSQEVLAFLTGLKPPLRPLPLEEREPAELQAALARARARHDVEAARRELEAAELEVSFARRERLPTVDLGANYYLHRVGFQESIDWDLTVSAALPLFRGGAIGARARAARARRRAAEEALTLALRSAELQTLSAWRDLESWRETLEARESAARLAEENAQAQAADYRLGVVTNLEVLESLTGLQENRLALERARLEEAWARARLTAASGGPPR